VINIGWPALVIGDLIFHQIALRWGRKILQQRGRFLFLTQARITKLELFFTRHGSKVIYFSKFIYGLGRNVLIVAGFLGWPLKKIIKYDLIGCLASIIFYAILGYLLGHSYIFLNDLLKGIGFILIALILLGITLQRLKVWRFIQHFPSTNIGAGKMLDKAVCF